MLMGTLCTAVAAGPDSAVASRAIEAAFAEIDRLENVLSSWRGRSELAQLNARAADSTVACSADFGAVLDSALAIARDTGGAFDPTVEPLDRAWDLRGAGRVPDAAELNGARACVGWAHVRRDAAGVRFERAGAGLDFGGIGKGYALDRALDVMRAHGIRSAVFNFGGELAGYRDSGAWTAPIADPARRDRAVVRLQVAAGAVSTSGQGERFFEAGGRRYGHIIDPVSGRPLDTRATVTAIAASGTRADGLSTALLVMGRERAQAYVRAHPDIGAVWLEPAARGVSAWRWNVPAIAEPGVNVTWMP